MFPVSWVIDFFTCLIAWDPPCCYNEKILLLSRLWWSDLVRVAVEAEVRL